jgi:hypothetical protein
MLIKEKLNPILSVNLQKLIKHISVNELKSCTVLNLLHKMLSLLKRKKEDDNGIKLDTAPLSIHGQLT